VGLDCHSQIIVELKAISQLTSREEAQILRYLKAMQRRIGLLINFGSVGKLEWKRFVRRPSGRFPFGSRFSNS